MILEPTWKLLAIHIPIYLQTVGYGKPLKRLADDPEIQYVKYPFIDVTTFEDDEPGIEGMTRQLIDLIGTFILNPGIHPLLKMGLGPFTHTLSSYLLLSQNQLEEYKVNPLYFVEESYSNVEIELGYTESIRTLSTRIIETLVETFGNATTEILLSIALENMSFVKNPVLKYPLKKSISEYDNASIYEYMSELFDQHEIWRKNELGLYILGLISDDLYIGMEKGQKFVNVDKIIAGLISMCNSSLIDNPLFLGRLLCTGSSCVQLFPKSTSTLKKLAETAVKGLRGKYSESVKNIACKCLVRCVHQMKELPIPNIETIIDHLPKHDIDNASIVTETVTTIFLYGNTKTLGKYIANILKSYLSNCIDNEGDGSELRYFISKVVKKEEYVGLVVDACVPLISPLVRSYPKGAEPDLTRVFCCLSVSN
jgi:hypothetical protein